MPFLPETCNAKNDDDGGRFVVNAHRATVNVPRATVNAPRATMNAHRAT